jgi:hypothetical protein
MRGLAQVAPSERADDAEALRREANAMRPEVKRRAGVERRDLATAGSAHRIALAALLGLCACHRTEPASSVTSSSAAAKSSASDALENDDRVAYRLAPCPTPEAFLADTSDMTSVLVAKLVTGLRDPQKSAKSELTAMGDAAVPELRNAFDRSFLDPNGEPNLLNILAVVSLARGDGGHDILLRGLEHPAEAVREAAIRGLVRHARREDYDPLLALLPISNPAAQVLIASALAASDKTRLEDEFLRLKPETRTRAFRKSVAAQISDTQRPEVIDAFVREYPNADPDLQSVMVGAAARAGNGEARSAIAAWSKDESSDRRRIAVDAMIRAGLAKELGARLREEKEDSIRATIASAIADLPPTAETHAWLSSGLSDRDRNVRLTCLLALVKQGDDAAENAALELLKGDSVDLAGGLRVLRESWRSKRSLAERAFSILTRLRAHEIEPVRVPTGAIDRAIAQVPLEEATRFLYDLAVKTPGEIEGLPAHRWFLQQAGNTGAEGWPFLRSRWDVEPDPRGRMDIVMACAYETSSDRARDFLITVAESDRSTPIEILYAADFLVHRGPAERIAPLLKRLALRIEEPNVRRALNCMLKEWYGPGT